MTFLKKAEKARDYAANKISAMYRCRRIIFLASL
jgi:hypothetical protein